MKETIHNVSKQVLLDTQRMSNGVQDIHDILRSRPFTSKKGILKAVDLILSFDAWSDPKSVITLFIDLKQEKFVRDKDRSPLCYHTGTESPIIDAALTCAAAIKNSLERNLDKTVVRKIVDISPKQKGSKKSIAYFKELTQTEIDEEVEYTIQTHNQKDRHNVGLTLALLTLWVNDIQSKHFDPWFLGIRSGGFHENNERVTEICKIKGDFASSSFVQKCLSTLNKRVLNYINEITEEEYFSIDAFLIDVLNENVSPKCLNTWIEYETLTDCYEYYRIAGRTSRLTSEYVAETVQAVFICYIQTCLEIITSAKPMYNQHPKLAQDMTKALQSKAVNPQDVYLYLNDIDERIILNSCAWTIKNRQVRDCGIKLIDEIIDAFEQNRASDLGGSSTENLDSKKVKKLQNKIHQMEKKQEYQSHVIAALQTENERLKRQKPVSNDKTNSYLLEYERKYNKAMKQLNKSQQELSDEKAKSLALEEKITLLSQPSHKTNGIFNIDPLKKYLFIVDDDRICSKIKAWFPNSVIAEHTEINPRNAKCYYMSVVMATKVSHVKYRHYKNKCIQFNIPVANCNGTNYQSICTAIHRCEQENNIIVT